MVKTVMVITNEIDSSYGYNSYGYNSCGYDSWLAENGTVDN